MHAWHVAQGALFEDVGQWKRALVLPQGRRGHARRGRPRVPAVRTAVGVLDASTLGKIDIQGPDAAEFLNRVYTNAFLEARGRPLPLRPDAQARTAW